MSSFFMSNNKLITLLLGTRHYAEDFLGITSLNPQNNEVAINIHLNTQLSAPF